MSSIYSMADLFSMTISLDYQQYSYLYLSPLKMNALNYISQDFHPSSTLNGGQVGDPVQLINVTKTEYLYKYNSKEWQDELGLDWYDYGWRNYDPALGRWINIDPMSEKYFTFSPYNYAGNNPALFIDPDGNYIDISYVYKKDKNGKEILDKEGNRILSEVNISITGKVINFSNNDVKMDEATENINAYIEDSFGGVFGDVKVNVSSKFTVAETMDDVSESDHLFVLAEPGEVAKKMDASGAAAGYYEKVAFLDADYFTGWFDRFINNTGKRTAAHELGHLFGLEHIPSGLMRPGGRKNKIHSWQINSILRSATKSNDAVNTDSKGLPYRGLVTPSVFRMTNTSGREKKKNK